MQRISIKKPGGYEHLRMEQVADAQPDFGEVLVETTASGVNYADCLIRRGLYASAKELVGYPITPGFEIAGTVARTGPGVTAFQPGDRVIGVTCFNGYASAAVLPQGQVFPVPDGMDLHTAAGFSTAFITAWFGIHELAHPRPGAAVLIHSAAGGVGSAMVQLCRQAGCRVAGVVGSPHKIAAVERMGADLVIDKSRFDLWREAEHFAPQGYDVIFDANGIDTLEASYRHLAAVGKLVVYGFHSMLPRSGQATNRMKLAWRYLRTPRFNPFELANRSRSVMGFNLSYLFDRRELLQDAMRQLFAIHRAGKIEALPVCAYPAQDAARAHEDLESGQTVGKLILVW